MTNEMMMNVLVNNGLGIEMTQKTLLDEKYDDVKQFDQFFLTTVIESKNHCLFIYFDELDMYFLDKKSGKIQVIEKYQEVIKKFCDVDLIEMNDELLDDDMLEMLGIELVDTDICDYRKITKGKLIE